MRSSGGEGLTRCCESFTVDVAATTTTASDGGDDGSSNSSSSSSSSSIRRTQEDSSHFSYSSSSSSSSSLSSSSLYPTLADILENSMNDEEILRVLREMDESMSQLSLSFSNHHHEDRQDDRLVFEDGEDDESPEHSSFQWEETATNRHQRQHHPYTTATSHTNDNINNNFRNNRAEEVHPAMTSSPPRLRPTSTFQISSQNNPPMALSTPSTITRRVSFAANTKQQLQHQPPPRLTLAGHTSRDFDHGSNSRNSTSNNNFTDSNSTTNSSSSSSNLPPSRLPLIEVSPGVFMQLRGSNESWKAVEAGQVVTATCQVCSLVLACIQDAECVLCPECRVVSPLEACGSFLSSTNIRRTGVGLGIRQEILYVEQE